MDGLTYALAWLSAALGVAVVVLAVFAWWEHRVIQGLQHTLTSLTTPRYLRTYRPDLEDRLYTDHHHREQRARAAAD